MLLSRTTHTQALPSSPSGRQRGAGKSLSLGARQPQAGILALPSSPSGDRSLPGDSTSLSVKWAPSASVQPGPWDSVGALQCRCESSFPWIGEGHKENRSLLLGGVLPWAGSQALWRHGPLEESGTFHCLEKPSGGS